MSERLWLVDPDDDENRVLLATRMIGPDWRVRNPEDIAERLAAFLDRLEFHIQTEVGQPFVEYWP